MRRLLALALILLAFPALAAEPVGSVTRLKGEASAGGRPLAQGAPIQQGDELATGPEARLEVRFSDGSVLTMGGDGRLTVDQLVFDPAAAKGLARFRQAAGAFLVQTGAIAKLPGRPLFVETPVATIGVRGTLFWGGPLDAALDVLVLEGAVAVENAAGRVELSPGQGTGVAAVGAAPNGATVWPAEKIGRAVRTVSFE